MQEFAVNRKSTWNGAGSTERYFSIPAWIMECFAYTCTKATLHIYTCTDGISHVVSSSCSFDCCRTAAVAAGQHAAVFLTAQDSSSSTTEDSSSSTAVLTAL
jgi:hypothetical protein